MFLSASRTLFVDLIRYLILKNSYLDLFSLKKNLELKLLFNSA